MVSNSSRLIELLYWLHVTRPAKFEMSIHTLVCSMRAISASDSSVPLKKHRNDGLFVVNRRMQSVSIRSLKTMPCDASLCNGVSVVVFDVTGHMSKT